MASPLQYKIHVVPASLWRRTAAFLLDLIVLNLVVLSPFEKVMKKAIPQTDILSMQLFLSQNPETTRFLSLLLFIMSGLVLFYFAFLEGILGKTLGKMVFKIQVQSAKPGMWRFIVSNLFVIPVFPFILLWIVDPLFLIFSKQRLSERLAGMHTVQHEVSHKL
jgi:uncharacterized RDD family membrane protein YckC